MKVTVINASPRKNGCTAALLDAFLSECNCDVTIYNIYDENIMPCIDCGQCKTTGKCFNNDMDEILKNIENSSHVVFASPVYNYSFPSPMKAFIDRLQPFYSDVIIDDKTEHMRKGFLLVAAGKSGKFSFEIMHKQAKIAFSELNSKFENSYIQCNTDKQITLQHDESCKVRNLASVFFSD